MLSRRQLLLATTMGTALRANKMTTKERVDRALKGQDVDRPPFTFWHHFRLEAFPGERHAARTLEFHRRYRTDLVKVMSDYPYPKGAGGLRGLKVEANPFPEQVRALEIIRDALGGSAYFIETIFNPYNQAGKIASKQEVERLRQESPRGLLDALEAIAESEANHARRALQIGAAGIFLAIDNHPQLTAEEYARFSEPFDRLVLEAAREAKLNVIHLHGARVYLDRFRSGWPAAVLNYEAHLTKIPLAEARRHYAGVLMGGIDEVNFRKLSEAELGEQWHAAQRAAGARFILAPGCSVPDQSTEEELSRLPRVLGA
ncbi:MAG: uroporphyrinogen decarboxylase family protein [Bryobacteraceae bacterium]|jgi:uroporphyrinogen decarboxylase